MDNEKECVEYFKLNNGYKRILKKMKNKFTSTGEIYGNIILDKPNREEKQAISGFMKKDYLKNKTITINLAKFEDRLNQTKYAGITLKSLLEGYFEEELISKKEKKTRNQENQEKFFLEILDLQKGTIAYTYIKEVLKEESINLKLRNMYNKNKNILEKDLYNVCKALNNMPRSKIRLPVFAANTIKNPHGFDRSNSCGKLLIEFLSYINNQNKPKNTEELAEIYYKNNILVDDVSNMVLCKNILGYKKTNKHEGWEGFFNQNEPIQVTLYNLSRITRVELKYSAVLVVENPAVFTAITDICKIKDFPIICTYGQVKLSGILLLNLISKEKCKIYYSGDIDPEGIQIADKLKCKYGEKLELIGFDKKTYNKNVSNIKLTKLRLNKLNNVKSEQLQELCGIIKQEKRAAYEELNIGEIVSWMEKIVI